MISQVFVQSYKDFPYNEKEILRYAGCKEADSDSAIVNLMRECTDEVSGLSACTFNLCYRIFPIVSMENGLIDFEAVKFQSHDLERCLRECDRAVFMSATLGQGLDRIIRKYNRTEPSKALFMQAIGAERVETMLDYFCKELPGMIEAITGEEGIMTRPRYSPGFGDLSLSVQPEFLKMVDANKRLGISLSDGYLMSPSKSVTAIIGIYAKKRNE